jgi:cell division protein FtsA
LLAVGYTLLSNEEKDLGCLLIDMGGQLTGVSIYAEGSIKFSREIPVGSDLITRDIAHALKTSIAQAQMIKEKYGVAIPSLIKKDDEIEFIAVDGKTRRKTTKRALAEIIAPRLEEIFDRISADVENAAYFDFVGPGGAIMTGGGSLLEGMTVATEKIFNLQTRLGVAQNVTGRNDIVSNPSYSAAIGLIKYKPVESAGRRKGPKSPIAEWFKDLIS